MRQGDSQIKIQTKQIAIPRIIGRDNPRMLLHITNHMHIHNIILGDNPLPCLLPLLPNGLLQLTNDHAHRIGPVLGRRIHLRHIQVFVHLPNLVFVIGEDRLEGSQTKLWVTQAIDGEEFVEGDVGDVAEQRGVEAGYEAGVDLVGGA